MQISHAFQSEKPDIEASRVYRRLLEEEFQLAVAAFFFPALETFVPMLKFFSAPKIMQN